MDKLQALFKDKKVLIGVGVVVLILLVGGVTLLSSHKNSGQQVATDSEVVPTIDPKSLGLSISEGSKASCQVVSSNNQLKFTLGKAQDIKHVAWVFTYDSDVPASDQVEGGSGKVTQSLEGEKDVHGSTFDSDYELMGTCSKNVCRCDTGVENIKLVLKITKNDGKVYQSTATFNPSPTSE